MLNPARLLVSPSFLTSLPIGEENRKYQLDVFGWSVRCVATFVRSSKPKSDRSLRLVNLGVVTIGGHLANHRFRELRAKRGAFSSGREKLARGAKAKEGYGWLCHVKICPTHN